MLPIARRATLYVSNFNTIFIVVMVTLPIFFIIAAVSGQLGRAGELSRQTHLLSLLPGVFQFAVGRYAFIASVRHLGAKRARGASVYAIVHHRPRHAGAWRKADAGPGNGHRSADRSAPNHACRSSGPGGARLHQSSQPWVRKRHRIRSRPRTGESACSGTWPWPRSMGSLGT
jgi:hypothetical protein